MATILSAQCTDERVNVVTRELFRKYRKPGDYVRVPQGEFGVLDLVTETTGKTYDLLICSEVLEHIEDDLGAMKNLRRMCSGHSGVESLREVASAHAPSAAAPSALRQKTSSNSPYHA